MFRRWLLALWKWTAALGMIAGGLAVAWIVHEEMRAERELEGDEESIATPRRVRDGEVELGTEAAERYGLAEAPARAATWIDRVTVHGEVVADPRATVEVRSTAAGMLRADPSTPWPSPGNRVRAGQVLGWIDDRVAPQDRLTLQDNLNQARLRKQGAEKVVELNRERVRRIESVSKSQIVPGQQLDDARVVLAEAETQLAIATAAVDLWTRALDEVDRPGHRETTTFSQPIVSPGDGEVTEVHARPGMSIEAGGAVAQLVDFRHTLIRLDLPPERLAAGPPGPVRVESIASGPATVEAVPVGPAPRVDAASQLVGYWFETSANRPGTEADAGETPWRPGLRVRALMGLHETPRDSAVAVPLGSVLFFQGRTLVYVRESPGKFRRREVRLLGREGDSYLLQLRRKPDPTGLDPGEIVVHRGAQILLSEEFRGGSDDD